MPILEKECPECGGNVHGESFIGHQGNTNAYTKRICIGDNGIVGQDGSYYINRASGCGFRAKKWWDSENKKETMQSNEDWKKWEQEHM